MIDVLDPYQINQMIWHCVDIFKNTKYPESYPPSSTNRFLYTDMGHELGISKARFRAAQYALQTRPFNLLQKHRHRKVEGTTGKHLMKKANKKGEGSSAAVLTDNMSTLVIFLEYVLCYHAFCKYSWSLPVFLQRHYDNIKTGNRFVVEYFQKLIYRGNNTVDSRFPKIHSQCRMAQNTVELNTVMNFCCETGERLLKTEAKGISRTAQQRGDTTFLNQTMSRIQDRSILDSFSLFLEEKEKSTIPPTRVKCDHFGRTHPHFVYDVDTDQVWSLNRRNEPKKPDDKSGNLDGVIIDALKKLEPQMKHFEIYNEVVLRDNSRLRAAPNYANSGPWYDYVNVSWERMVTGGMETYLLPAKCLCFYRKECQETTSSPEIMALIHSAVAGASASGKINSRTDTLLTRNYRMEFDNKGRPITHIVPVASIDCSVRCFSHSRSKVLFSPDPNGITYLLPRNHWAYVWMAMNDSIQQSNTRNGKLTSLCNNQWMERVRKRYQQYLNASSIKDVS
jgi:hypothetical protein